jgi:hypothetical protein
MATKSSLLARFAGGMQGRTVDCSAWQGGRELPIDSGPAEERNSLRRDRNRSWRDAMCITHSRGCRGVQDFDRQYQIRRLRALMLKNDGCALLPYDDAQGGLRRRPGVGDGRF